MPRDGSGRTDETTTLSPSRDSCASDSASDPIELAVQAIESEFAGYMPHADRVAAACDALHRGVPSWDLPAAGAWLPRLLALPARRSGPIVQPVFDLLEKEASWMRSPWPVLEALLSAQDAGLQGRALDAIARAAAQGRLPAGHVVAEAVARRVEEDGSALAKPEALRKVAQIAATAGLPPTLRLFVEGSTMDVRRMAARLLDVDPSLPGDEVVRWLLGDAAAAALSPYLAYTRATHLELLDVLPLAADPAALDSFRRAEQACGERAWREAVAALGWQRLNLGLEAHPYVGISASGAFPLLLSPSEAALFDGCAGARRVFDKTLIVSVGSRGTDASAPAGARDGVARFRACNIVHAEVLSDILDVAPLTRARLQAVRAKMDRLVADFAALFGSSSDRATCDEAAALVRVHAGLNERMDRALAQTQADPLPIDLCRLVQTFEDPAGPADIRTLHGLKRYLHQRGLKLAFGLIGTGPKTTRTIDLAVITPGHGVEVGRHIEFVDLEGGAGHGAAPVIPYQVRLVVDAFARQILHGQTIPSHVRVFCYGNEVHYFARFRNHPAFIRIDYSPPLRGGMIDLQYLGVSNNDLDVHPSLALDAIRLFFERLDFIVSVDSTRIQARYDKERAVTLDDLHRRAALLFHLVPYLMDLDWTIGSLQVKEDAKRLVAAAWAEFFLRQGVLPMYQFLTKDRADILIDMEAAAEGAREVRWDGAVPYRDRFTVSPADAVVTHVRDTVLELGLDVTSPVEADDVGGQLALDAKVLAPLRRALARGEIVVTPAGLARRSGEEFERVHEVDRLAATLDSTPDTIAVSAQMAQAVSLLERHVRFRTTGSINGHDVQRARLSLGPSVLTMYVLRDGEGMPRLACAAEDDSLYRRRDRPGEPWCESGPCDVGRVLGMLRAANLFGSAPEPAAADPSTLADDLRRLFRAPRPPSGRRTFSDERVAAGVSASPGRAAGPARLGVTGRRPDDLQGGVLFAARLEPKDAPCLFHASGVVSTGGGILSHLGLLAVESGKPSLIVDATWGSRDTGEPVLRFKTIVYDEREREGHGYRLVERLHVHEVDDEIRDGDLVVIDADQGAVNVLGHDPVTLAFHEALRQQAAASTRLARASADDVLVERGHHLRTRYQLEKVLARVASPALVRYGVEEVLLGAAWTGTALAAIDGARVLRQLADAPTTGECARAAIRQVTARLAGRVREAREHATRLISSSTTFHDVLALRLNVARLHETLRRVVGALERGGLDAGVVAGGDQDDLDRLALGRLAELRDDMIRSLADAARTGGRSARVAQLRRVDELLAPAADREPGSAGLPSTPLPDSSMAPLPSTTLRPGRAGKSCATYVVTPRDGGLELGPIVGAKAANLAEVARILGDDSVPDWFAVTDCAFQDALGTPASGSDGAPTLGAAIAAILEDGSGTHAAHALAIRGLWERFALPAPIATSVAAGYRALGPECHVAIRSSALDEDTEGATRAGQFDTFLFVRGEQAVLDHLKLAWSGLWTERALHDRAARHDGRLPHGGIVVQRMVRARVSGVLQTVNAADARPRELVMNVVLGLGEGIVSGTVSADHVVVVKDHVADATLRFRYVTADKRQRVIFDERFGQGTVRVDTLAHQRLRPALEYPELRELVDVAMRLEQAYGHPLDLEFGFEDAALRILQARPVPAALAVWRDTKERFPLKATDWHEEALR